MMSTAVPTGLTTWRVYCKGAAEVVLRRCVRVMRMDGVSEPLGTDARAELERTVLNRFAQDGLRIICIAIRDIDDQAEPVDWDNVDQVEAKLTCACICGIEDPVREEVPDAIAKCKAAGITVRMVTGDNVETARSIALKCGITERDWNSSAKHLVMEGPEFRRLVFNERNEFQQAAFDRIWPNLRVLARSSPTDKYWLVKGLRESRLNGQAQVVAVTGDGTNDGPALRQADVGFAMGITGTAIAKEASDIILMDDNFDSIVSAVKWGRNVNDNIGKFLQFQLTVNLVAVVITIVGVIKAQFTPLTAVQMLWINMIMDSLASLALATELPNDRLLYRNPYPKERTLITRKVLRFIFGHAVYQLTVLFALLWLGATMLGCESDEPELLKRELSTVIFNTFVVMQLFNEINARKVNGEMNVFEGLMSHYQFFAILILTAVIQFVLVTYGGSVLSCEPPSARSWLITICFGVGELPWNLALHFIVPGFLVAADNEWSNNSVMPQLEDAAGEIMLDVDCAEAGSSSSSPRLPRDDDLRLSPGRSHKVATGTRKLHAHSSFDDSLKSVAPVG
jgi:Ca2+ transporting ATPase